MKKSRHLQKLNVVTGVDTPDGTPRAEITLEELSKDDPTSYVINEHIYLHNRYFIKESDRAVGVLAPAYLDEVLTRAIRAKLLPTTSTANLVSSDRGPLASFASKIDLARSLGLIEEITWKNLHVLRKIRNDFAHDVDLHDFSHDTIIDKCRNLIFPADQKIADGKDARRAFTTCVWLISWELSKVAPAGT